MSRKHLKRGLTTRRLLSIGPGVPFPDGNKTLQPQELQPRLFRRTDHKGCRTARIDSYLFRTPLIHHPLPDQAAQPAIHHVRTTLGRPQVKLTPVQEPSKSSKWHAAASCCSRTTSSADQRTVSSLAYVWSRWRLIPCRQSALTDFLAVSNPSALRLPLSNLQ